MPFLFLRKQEILDLQFRLVEEFGGLHGLRDEGALESALTAAQNLELIGTPFSFINNKTPPAISERRPLVV